MIKVKSKPKSTKVKSKSPNIKSLKSSKSSKITSKLPEKENSSLLRKALITGGTIAATTISGFLFNELHSHVKENYGIYLLGNTAQRKQYNKDRRDIENALNKPVSFKNYMENSRFDFRLNYIQDKKLIDEYNNSIPRPAQKIKSLYEYILHAKILLKVDPYRPYDPDYYKSTEDLSK
jgi:hypothetical protein